MVPASSPTHAVHWEMGAASSRSYLGAETEGWGAGQGAAGPPSRPCRGPPALLPRPPLLGTARRGGCWGLEAAVVRAGGSLTWGRAKGAGAGGDAEPCGRAGAKWRGGGGQGGTVCHHPGHRTPVLPAVGGTKGPFMHPWSTGRGGGVAPAPPSPHRARASSQHPWGLPKGFGGLHPVLGAPDRGCHSRERSGVAPPTRLQAAPPPPDKRLKVRLYQLPSPGRAGGVGE